MRISVVLLPKILWSIQNNFTIILQCSWTSEVEVREERKPCSALSPEFDLHCGKEWRACFNYLRGSLLPLLFFFFSRFLYLLHCTGKYPKSWFYVTDPLLPMVSAPVRVILEAWFPRCGITSAPGMSPCLLCSPPAAPWALCSAVLFYIPTSPGVFFTSSSPGDCGEKIDLYGCSTELRGELSASASRNSLWAHQSPDESVDNSEVLCNHFQRLVLSSQVAVLQSSTEVVK